MDKNNIDRALVICLNYAPDNHSNLANICRMTYTSRKYFVAYRNLGYVVPT